MISNFKNAKRLALDMAINLIGTAFPVFVLQLIVYPFVAQRLSSEAYGGMQSVMSVLYLVAGTLGGSLSTTRLIRESEYKNNHLLGDFNILYSFAVCITACSVPVIIFFYLKGCSAYDILLIALLSLLLLSYNYCEVGFRLELNYKKMLTAKIFMCLGYMIGFYIFTIFPKWQLIFIASYSFPLVYALCTTSLIQEPSRKTGLFRSTAKVYGNLTFSMALSKSQTYFDKLLLYPFLGGAAVSVYFAANIFGKLVMQVLEPITNVMLSYLSRKTVVENSIWRLTFSIGGLFCIGMYVICMVLSAPVLWFLYPQWAEEALSLVPVATASLCVSSFVGIIAPLTLKTFESNAQILINGTSLLAYILLLLSSYKTYGLLGCCMSLLLSYCIKLLVILFLFFKKKKSAQAVK